MNSWKLSVPCTRAEAEAIDASEDVAEGMVLMTTELQEDDREHWRLDAYLEAEPDAATITAIRALAPSAAGVAPAIEKLPEEDWVTLSQQGLEPIAEGRFVVHTSAHPVEVPEGGRAFLIEAGQAFGTGHHATTSGCLAMLDALPGPFARIIDIGTGTGLLAFAAQHLWPEAHVIATDIDPRAIEVTAENAALNGIKGVDLIVADGALDDRITERSPYDLLIANILAGPLVSMAPGNRRHRRAGRDDRAGGIIGDAARRCGRGVRGVRLRAGRSRPTRRLVDPAAHGRGGAVRANRADRSRTGGMGGRWTFSGLFDASLGPAGKCRTPS